jgi:hypothetical protein
MTVCATIQTLHPNSIYPVIDPRRTAGLGQYFYGYEFGWDALIIRVGKFATPGCSMTVDLRTALSEPKEIQSWNLFSNTFNDSIVIPTVGVSNPRNSMTLTRAGSSGLACGAGTDTVVLCRHFAWPRGRTALYTFDPQDFWDFWGGRRVTFEWISDTIPQGNWGNQAPPIKYPVVQLPDRALMMDGPRFRVVFGGTDFVVTNPAYLTAMNLNTASAIPLRLLRLFRRTTRCCATPTGRRCMSSTAAPSSTSPRRPSSTWAFPTGARSTSFRPGARRRSEQGRSTARSSRKGATPESTWSQTKGSAGLRVRRRWTGCAWPGGTCEPCPTTRWRA